ncbi:MAG: hypothetical protein ACK5LL_14855 [Suipraeoptans sp.]
MDRTGKIIVKIIVITIVILFIFIFLFEIVNNIRLSDKEIRNERTTFGFMATSIAESLEDEELWKDLSGFENIEEAIEFYYRNDLTRLGYEIVRFEEEPYYLVVVSGNTNGPVKRIPSITMMFFEKRVDGKYYFLNHWEQGVEKLDYDNRMKWYSEDRIARDIVYAYVREEYTSLINGQMPLYYGMGVGSIPEYLTILGHEPDEIIQFENINKDYYFWYYRTDYEFGKVLEENIDIDDLRLSDVIDCFEIEVSE